jgi:hypothetical protein
MIDKLQAAWDAVGGGGTVTPSTDLQTAWANLTFLTTTVGATVDSITRPASPAADLQALFTAYDAAAQMLNAGISSYTVDQVNAAYSDLYTALNTWATNNPLNPWA